MLRQPERVKKAVPVTPGVLFRFLELGADPGRRGRIPERAYPVLQKACAALGVIAPDWLMKGTGSLHTFWVRRVLRKPKSAASEAPHDGLALKPSQKDPKVRRWQRIDAASPVKVREDPKAGLVHLDVPQEVPKEARLRQEVRYIVPKGLKKTGTGYTAPIEHAKRLQEAVKEHVTATDPENVFGVEEEKAEGKAREEKARQVTALANLPKAEGYYKERFANDPEKDKRVTEMHTWWEACQARLTRKAFFILEPIRLLGGILPESLDMLHDSYVKMYEKLEQFDPETGPDGFVAWGGKIMLNVLRSAYRKETVKSPDQETRQPRNVGGAQMGEGQTLWEALVDTGIGGAVNAVAAVEGVQELFVRLTESDTLTRAVRRLPSGQRDVATFYYLDQRPVLEVAEALGMPEGTVKTRLRQARASLRADKEIISMFQEHFPQTFTSVAREADPDYVASQRQERAEEQHAAMNRKREETGEPLQPMKRPGMRLRAEVGEGKRSDKARVKATAEENIQKLIAELKNEQRKLKSLERQQAIVGAAYRHAKEILAQAARDLGVKAHEVTWGDLDDGRKYPASKVERAVLQSITEQEPEERRKGGRPRQVPGLKETKARVKDLERRIVEVWGERAK